MTDAALLGVPVSMFDAELARRSLLRFTQYTFPDYEVNWHHRAVASCLDRVLTGELRRLMVFLPPQVGKSELVSRRFPAYALGRQPDLRLVSSSYSAALAHDMSRDVQKVMDSAEYREVFPGTRLATARDDEARTSDHFEVVGRRGYYKAVGVGGGLTGRTADIGIIDDPVKNRAEAESETYRKNVWDWFTSTFYTRQFGDTGRIVICLTRWHEDDLAGRLLRLQAEQPDADRWTVVSLPAIAEAGERPDDPRSEGEALWPAKYPLAELARRKAVVGSYDWSALYQQRPTPTEGGLIKRAWFRWYPQDEPPAALDEIVVSFDTALRAKQSNDYTSGQVWGRRGPHAFALRMIHGRWDFPELLQQMRDLSAFVRGRWAGVPMSIVIENAGAGPEAIAELKRSLTGVFAENPKGDKQQRVHAVTPMLESGNVWLPGVALPDGKADTTLSPAWVDPFVEECAGFPFGAHDDQVDAMTQALRRLHRPKQGVGMTHLSWL